MDEKSWICEGRVSKEIWDRPNKRYSGKVFVLGTPIHTGPAVRCSSFIFPFTLDLSLHAPYSLFSVYLLALSIVFPLCLDVSLYPNFTQFRQKRKVSPLIGRINTEFFVHLFCCELSLYCYQKEQTPIQMSKSRKLLFKSPTSTSSWSHLSLVATILYVPQT